MMRGRNSTKGRNSMFSDNTKLVVKSVVAQATGTVIGGAVFQVGVRFGNACYDGLQGLVAAVTGSDRK